MRWAKKKLIKTSERHLLVLRCLRSLVGPPIFQHADRVLNLNLGGDNDPPAPLTEEEIVEHTWRVRDWQQVRSVVGRKIKSNGF